MTLVLCDPVAYAAWLPVHNEAMKNNPNQTPDPFCAVCRYEAALRGETIAPVVGGINGCFGGRMVVKYETK